jgi:predicted ATPase
MIFEKPVFSLREELLRKQLCIELPLAPFDETLVENFLAQRFENDTVASLLAPIAYARTEGNPFLLRALSQYLVDEGLVAQIGGGLELGVDPAELAQRSLEHWMEVPQSIRHMVELELGRLSSTECALIEAVSLAGVEFPAQLAADALDLDLEEFEETCDLLARRGQFIRRSGEVEWPDGSIGARYCFSHALYRDVLQQRLSTTRRRRLHQRFRARLEDGFPGHTDDIAGQLATHCEGFGALEQAVHWLERAARVAMRRYENREVESLLSRALDLLRQLPEHEERTDRELRLLLALGPAVASRNGVGCAQVRQIYSQALELCDRLGSDALLDSALPALGAGNGERSAGGLGPDDRNGEAGEAALPPGQNGMGGGLRRVVSALRARRQTNAGSK